MNVFPENSNKTLRTVGYIVIVLAILVSIPRGILDAVVNGLFWWFVFWLIAKFTQNKKTSRPITNANKTKKKALEITLNKAIEKEGIFTINDFFKEYELNSVRAKQQYVGKPLKIQGLVRDIYQSGNLIVGEAFYVVLSELNETGEEFDGFKAKFSLLKKNIKPISSLNIGDHIVISGTVQGFEKGKTNMYFSSIEE